MKNTRPEPSSSQAINTSHQSPLRTATKNMAPVPGIPTKFRHSLSPNKSPRPARRNVSHPTSNPNPPSPAKTPTPIQSKISLRHQPSATQRFSPTVSTVISNDQTNHSANASEPIQVNGANFPEILSLKEESLGRWIGDEEDWELRTETVGQHDDDGSSLAEIKAAHTRQLGHYKNLLVRAQSASSSSLHDLHSKLLDLEGRYARLSAEHAQCADRLKMAEASRGAITSLKKLEVGAGVDDLVKGMSKSERISFLGTVAEACHPSDIAAQITILEQYRRSRLDILGRLDNKLVTRIMFFLEVEDVLNLRLISSHYAEKTRLPDVWRTFCRQLEYREWGGSQGISALPESPEGGWEMLYKSLWRRERNWDSGLAQKVMLLTGHTNYVTSLKLRGNTLVSGSYDETIRIWHLPPFSTLNPERSSLHPLILPAKSVSCLDYLPDDDLFVAGSHDIGRVQVWKMRASGNDWDILHTLQGHLHGIRAVAINESWLVSAGADKALVVWDWRTGQKIVRFGQQTNICVGIQLISDLVIAVTVDGIIRTFSISKRQMLAQFKLADLSRGPQAKERLKDVGGGVGGSGMLTWFEGQGRYMTCATREMILRLEWDEEENRVTHTLPDNITSSPIQAASPSLHKVRSIRGLQPKTPTRTPSLPIPSEVSPRMLRKGSTPSLRTPTKPSASFIPSPSKAVAQSPAQLPKLDRKSATPKTSSRNDLTKGPSSHSSPPSSVRGSVASTRRSSSNKIDTTSPLRKTSSSSLPFGKPDSVTQENRYRVLPVLSKPPRIVEIIETPDSERGTIDASRNRIISSTRFALRTGADRHIYLGAPNKEGTTEMIPVRGAWTSRAGDLQLQTPEKNPMSLVLDREKFAYGCTDGTIVVVGFVGHDYSNNDSEDEDPL